MSNFELNRSVQVKMSTGQRRGFQSGEKGNQIYRRQKINRQSKATFFKIKEESIPYRVWVPK